MQMTVRGNDGIRQTTTGYNWFDLPENNPFQN